MMMNNRLDEVTTPKHSATVLKNYLQRPEQQGLLQQMVSPHRALISASWSPFIHGTSESVLTLLLVHF